MNISLIERQIIESSRAISGGHPGDADAVGSQPTSFLTLDKSRRGTLYLALAIFVVVSTYNFATDWIIERYVPATLHVSWDAANNLATALLIGVMLFYFVRMGTRETRRTAERLRTVFEVNGDAIFVSDYETNRFIDVNEAACAMFGYSRDEMLDLDILAISEGSTSYSAVEIVKHVEAARSGSTQPFEWHCRARGGRLFWTETTLRVVEIAGRTIGLSVTRDITKRKEAELAAAESNRFLEALFQNAESAIVNQDISRLFRHVHDIKQKGVVNFREYILADERRLMELPTLIEINAVNRAAYRLLEWPEGQAWSAEKHFSHRENVLNVLYTAEAIFNGDTSMRREGEMVSFTGEHIPILHCLPIPQTEGEAKRIPKITVDLREIKMAEVARQASAAKSQFLASMSHEIRTPLNGVIGNLELLGLTAPSNEQHELIEQADKAAKALMALIGNILDFSKIEQGKLTIEMGEMSPSDVVEEAVAVLQTKARQKGIFITAMLDPNVPELVRSDVVRLRQILLNLIGNAVKFTDQGSIAVTAAVGNLDGELCELKFTVHDSGRGFDQSVADDLFEPFVQDRISLDTSEGTGLGLSICRKLAEAMGGSISCEGVRGGGASFWFTLPVQILKNVSYVKPADLTGSKIAIVGGRNPGMQPLKNYFITRGASVVVAKDIAATFEALRPLSGEKLANVMAVLVPATEPPFVSVCDLKSSQVVPIMYGADGSFRSYRLALRAGYAGVISTAEGPGLLDRNVGSLLGQIPHQGPQDATPTGAVEVIPSVQGKRVLVLEDRLVNQLIIQKQLATLKVAFTLVGDGLKGLSALQQEDFDIILCDCSMPNMNGFDFTRTVRAREKTDGGTRHMPIIALTANAFREDMEKCLQAGMDDFISKPVSLERLIDALNKWLGAEQKASVVTQTDQAQGSAAIDLTVLQGVLGPNGHGVLNEILGEFAQAAKKFPGGFAIGFGQRPPERHSSHGARRQGRGPQRGGEPTWGTLC